MKPPHIAFAAALALTACGPIVQIGGNVKPPQSLLVLSASAAPRPYAGPPQLASALGVDTPAVPAMLQNLRVPVATTDTQITYLAGASWAEPPNRQFQRLLADTLAAGGIPVIDGKTSNIAPPRHIGGTLRSFGVDAANPALPVVRVRFDAQITGPGAAIGLRRFDAEEPVPVLQPAAVGAALNRAANRVAADVTSWVAR
jgi:cholesterol transport system auxiliary component